jgi:hypothetical protein
LETKLKPVGYGTPCHPQDVSVIVDEKLPNKKGELDPDRRNSQYLYYTTEYYEANNIKSSDLKQVALLACGNKLEKRPLAVKLITQII